MRARLVFVLVCVGGLLAGLVAVVGIVPGAVLTDAVPAAQASALETEPESAVAGVVVEAAAADVVCFSGGYPDVVVECPPVPVEHCVDGSLVATLPDALPDPVVVPGDAVTVDGVAGTLSASCGFVADPVLVTYCVNGVATQGTEAEAGDNERPGDVIVGGDIGIVGDDCGFILATQFCVDGVLTTTPADQVPVGVSFPFGPATIDGVSGTLDGDCAFTPELIVVYCSGNTLTEGTETQAAGFPRPGDTATLDNGIAGTLTSTCEFITNTYCAFGGIVLPADLDFLFDRFGTLSQPGDTVNYSEGITGTFTTDCNIQFTGSLCVAQTGGGFTLETNYLAMGAQRIVTPGTIATDLNGVTGTLGPDCELLDGDGDGVPDGTDNCPEVSNAGQESTYLGADGNACKDTDGNGVLDVDEPHICISTNGTERIQKGNTSCFGSTTAIAHGDNAEAYASAANSTATANGDNAEAYASAANSTATANGDNAEALASVANSTATANGDNAGAYAYAANSTATANGDNAEAVTTTDGCVATAIGAGADAFC